MRPTIVLPLVAAGALLAGCGAARSLPGQTQAPPSQPSSSSASRPVSPSTGSGITQGSGAGSRATSLTDGAMSPQQVVKLVTPSVVRIEASGSASGSGASSLGRGSSTQSQGSGTGVVIDANGHILTNNHVVTLESSSVASKISVVLSDGRTLDAKVVGRDPGTDLALLQVNAQNLTPAKFAPTGSVEVGEPVLAIGYAFNIAGTPTVTDGVVSATDRIIPENTTSISGAIQTNAPINPGNSGGPLVDLAGEVVGINTAGQGSNSQGIFFAISSDVAQPIVSDLLSKGKIDRGFIGIQTHTATADEAKAENSPTASGTVVDGVQPGTPADKAGLRAGDIIVKLGTHDVHNTGDLQSALIDQPSGTKVTVTFYRGSDKKTLDVTLTSRPDNS